MSQDVLHFNGINGATGSYGLAPMTGRELTEVLRNEDPAPNSRELKRRHDSVHKGDYGVKAGVDPGDIGQAGWGIVFAARMGPAVREALRPLMDLRREQAGHLFKEYWGGNGYRPGDTKEKFLRRSGGGGSGPVDPEKVPYYLLLVGSPEEIPYRFQNLLGVPHAVGRISFDTPQEYANYAASVVAAERREIKRQRRLGYFGVANADDKATQMSAANLIDPMFQKLSSKDKGFEHRSWTGDEATKANLASLLGGEDTPALLFSASHGMEFPAGHPNQLAHQGALLCQDWPGPRQWRKAIPQDFYFAGDDVASDASLAGLLFFQFACYGGGTPQLDEYTKQAFKDHHETIAPYPFLADLPKRLLSHPKGGALAFVGHVDRAWSYSFMAPGLGSQTNAFESTFVELLDGLPVGAAMEYFTNRYAEISTELNTLLENMEYPNIEVDDWDVADKWTANNDARGYLILGDPAVRMAVAKPDEEVRQRSITVAEVTTSGASQLGDESVEDTALDDAVDAEKADLLRLLDRVAGGEEIVLKRAGRRVARLVPD